MDNAVLQWEYRQLIFTNISSGAENREKITQKQFAI